MRYGVKNILHRCAYKSHPIFFFSSIPALQIAITSKAKTQTFGQFGDVYEEAYDPANKGTEGQVPGGGWEGPPSTFAVPLLDPHFFDQDGESLSPRFVVDEHVGVPRVDGFVLLLFFLPDLYGWDSRLFSSGEFS